MLTPVAFPNTKIVNVVAPSRVLDRLNGRNYIDEPTGNCLGTACFFAMEKREMLSEVRRALNAYAYSVEQ